MAFIILVTAVSLAPRRAAAEKVLANVGDWQVYSDGRAGAFASWAYGDGYPQANQDQDMNGNFVTVSAPSLDGGFRSVSEQLQIAPGRNTQGTINMVRFRSGFVSNVFGFGVRGKLTEWTTLSAYVQFWAYVENDGRAKNLPNPVDARQGYAKLEGPWGSFTMGRVRALFSRGATDIDVLYAHRWGLGFPGTIDNRGPTLGQIGFGVLGNGFSSGMIYGTPSFGGLQLDVGAFDAVVLPGMGNWGRTKYPLAQGELTFQRTLGDGWGKVVVFLNGAYQKVYKDGSCTPFVDMETNDVVPCSETVAGAGYGARLELGPVHLGFAGHTGRGLGLNYALETSDVAQDKQGNLRRITGWYLQSQVVIKKFDVFAGAGLVQAFLTDYDNKHTEQDQRDPSNPNARAYPFNALKRRIGINAGIVYNATPNLHFDLDFFRAEADFYNTPDLNNAGVQFPDMKQVIWVGNGGMTVNW